MHFTKVANLVLNTGSRKAGNAQDPEKYQSLVSLCLSVDKVLLSEIQRLAKPLTWAAAAELLTEGRSRHPQDSWALPNIQWTADIVAECEFGQSLFGARFLCLKSRVLPSV